MSFWVLGTDTAVGKTVTSALILKRHGGEGALAYWKPVSTGGVADRDRSTVSTLLGAGSAIPLLEETYLLDEPVSPHLAAHRMGVVIDPERILADLVAHGLSEADHNLLVEGAGGVLVPLDGERRLLYADLVAETTLPAVVVARTLLGTINHTLLTIEALRHRGIEVIGVVLNGTPNEDNRRAIESFGRVRIVAEVPQFPVGAGASLGAAEIATAAAEFDREGVLAEYL